MKGFPTLLHGTFIERLNRFTVLCKINGKIEKAYLPNPGRLFEILLPGRLLYLSHTDNPFKIPFIVLAAEIDGTPVMLHTHLTNDYVYDLLKKSLIPGLESFRPIRREVRIGSSRFDFLLESFEGRGIQGSAGHRNFMVLEVKTCTLFSGRFAFFPDAVTIRGRRHLEELSRLKEKTGWLGGVLFLVWWPEACYFLPEYHIDIEFTKTLIGLRNRLFIRAIAVGVKRDLTIDQETTYSLAIPWKLIESEARDRGAYILVFEAKEPLNLSIGRLGNRFFPRGFYLYAGSARNGLEARLARHRHKRKTLFWHIDYLRDTLPLKAILPIRTPSDVECMIAKNLSRVSSVVHGFGSSDCSCEGHLFRMDKNPLHFPPFLEILHQLRYSHLKKKLNIVI
ncbi:MAG: DNA/RNA nuclease SfsA [Spirochaetota bacterium]